jgi:hypothetical protein
MSEGMTDASTVMEMDQTRHLIANHTHDMAYVVARDWPEAWRAILFHDGMNGDGEGLMGLKDCLTWLVGDAETIHWRT